MHKKPLSVQLKYWDQMLIFREYSQIFSDVDDLYCYKRLLCFNALQHCFCLVTERAIGFRVELESHGFRFQQR